MSKKRVNQKTKKSESNSSAVQFAPSEGGASLSPPAIQFKKDSLRAEVSLTDKHYFAGNAMASPSFSMLKEKKNDRQSSSVVQKKATGKIQE